MEENTMVPPLLVTLKSLECAALYKTASNLLHYSYIILNLWYFSYSVTRTHFQSYTRTALDFDFFKALWRTRTHVHTHTSVNVFIKPGNVVCFEKMQKEESREQSISYCDRGMWLMDLLCVKERKRKAKARTSLSQFDFLQRPRSTLSCESERVYIYIPLRWNVYAVISWSQFLQTIF